MLDIQQLLFLKNEFSLQYLLVIIFVPVISKFIENMIYKIELDKFFIKIFYKEWNMIEIMGIDTIRNSTHYIDYPKAFIGISYYAYTNGKCNKLKNVILSRNNYNYYDPELEMQDDNQNYIIDDCSNIMLEDEIYLDLISINNTVNQDKKRDNDSLCKLKMILKSKKHDATHLRNFINQCINQYEKYLKCINENKIFHFIYKEYDQENKKLLFSNQIISDFNDNKNLNFETFDNIFHEHKNKIIEDIIRLNDIEYYKKQGMKRKKGYLFYGFPGCGKTSTVMAIANKTKRHIIEVPMSRVKTNLELEEIMYMDEINGIKFEKDQIILLFDEIDYGTINLKKEEKKNKRNKETEEKEKKNESEQLIELLANSVSVNKKPDELSLGTILSRFDGIGSYNGLIIIATTNHKDKLPESLYRNGRLDPLFFGYARKIDIINMIEKYYEIKMTEIQKEKIPYDGFKVSHATIKYSMEQYSNPNELLDYFDLLESSK